MKTDACKGCGKPIVYAQITKADGTPGVVPLDPRAPVYRVGLASDGTVRAWRAAKEDETSDGGTHMVSHFATCPKASQFSGSKPAARTTPTGNRAPAPPSIPPRPR